MGSVQRIGLQMERFGVQTTELTQGKQQVFRYHQGWLLVPRTITSLQSLFLALSRDSARKVTHSVSLDESRLHNSYGRGKANSNKYIKLKGSKQSIKIHNLCFMNWSYTHSVCGIKRNTDFLTDFLFPAVTKMHPLKAASHKSVILLNLSLIEPTVNNFVPCMSQMRFSF